MFSSLSRDMLIHELPTLSPVSIVFLLYFLLSTNIFTSALLILEQMFWDFLRLILPEDQLANRFYDWNSDWNT